MGHITITREIEAPIEAVFDYVDDHRNTTRYMRGLTKWSPVTEVVHGKDAEFEVVMKAGPRDLSSVVRITSWTANRTIAWKSVKGFTQTGKWAFSKRGDHTEATFDMDYDLGGGIAGRMLGRVVEPVVRHNLEQSVEALKTQMETRKSTPSAPRSSKAAPAETPASSRTATASKRAPAKAPGSASKNTTHRPKR